MTEPTTAAQEVAHVTFNPTPLGLSSPLAAVCDDYERGGWRLVRVVPHHTYESVAVFVRGGSDGESFQRVRDQINPRLRALLMEVLCG